MIRQPVEKIVISVKMNNHNRKRQIINCTLCSRTFIDYRNYVNHWNIKHRNESKSRMFENAVQCNTCQEYFRNKQALCSHKASVYRKCKQKATSDDNLYFLCQSDANTLGTKNLDELNPAMQPVKHTAVINCGDVLENVEKKFTMESSFNMIPLLYNENSRPNGGIDNHDVTQPDLFECPIYETVKSEEHQREESVVPMPKSMKVYSVSSEENLPDYLSAKQNIPDNVSAEFPVNEHSADIFTNDSAPRDNCFAVFDSLNVRNYGSHDNSTVGKSSSTSAKNADHTLSADGAITVTKNTGQKQKCKSRRKSTISLQTVNVNASVDVSSNHIKTTYKKEETKNYKAKRSRADVYGIMHCHICDESFSALCHYRKHFLDKHKEYAPGEISDGSWKCSLCSCVSQSFWHLQLHWLQHHRDKYDPAIFAEFVNLERKGKWNQKRISVPITTETITSVDDCINTCATDSCQREKEGESKVEKPKNRSFTCRVCGSSLSTIGEYRSHFKNKHKEYSTEDMFEDGWKCSLCSSVHYSLYSLRAHWQKNHAAEYDANLFSEFITQQVNDD